MVRLSPRRYSSRNLVRTCSAYLSCVRRIGLRHSRCLIAVGVLPDLGDGGGEEEFDGLFVRRTDDVEAE